MKRIIIKVQKTVDRGAKGFKIVKLSGLEFEQLPERYTISEVAVIYKERVMIGAMAPTLKRAGVSLLQEGLFYEKKEFFSALKKIKKGGELLAEINSQLRKENAGWKGEKTFTI